MDFSSCWRWQSEANARLECCQALIIMFKNELLFECQQSFVFPLRIQFCVWLVWHSTIDDNKTNPNPNRNSSVVFRRVAFYWTDENTFRIFVPHCFAYYFIRNSSYIYKLVRLITMIRLLQWQALYLKIHSQSGTLRASYPILNIFGWNEKKIDETEVVCAVLWMNIQSIFKIA